MELTTGMVWRVLYWTWCLSEVLLIVVTRTRSRSGTVRDRGSLYVLWVVIFSSIWVGSWYGATHAPTMFGGAAWEPAAACWVMAIGLTIRWVAVISLGRAFSVNVAIHADQRLYRGGLYAVVRHPSYTGLLLIFVALGLRLENWGAFVIVVVPPIAALLYRMEVEERALESAFGGDYVAYRRTTKRLVPGVY